MPKRKQPSSRPPAKKDDYTPTPEDKRLVLSHLDRRQQSRRAPKVSVDHEPPKPAEITPKHPDLSVGSIQLTEAFGTVESSFANKQLTMLINATHGDREQPIDQETVNAALAAVNGIDPGDEIEAMLATQMVATNHAAMELLRRTGQTDYVNKTNVYGNLAVKFLRTFTAQLEALQRYRVKGTQKIVVERVNVGEGGQAIVGSVEQGKLGGGLGGKNEDQSHAKQHADASEPEMRSEDEAGDVVPSTGGKR